MKDKKKTIAIIIVITILIIGIIMIVNMVKNSNKRKATFEGNTATSNVVLEDIEFKNIIKNYDNGVTSIRAEVYNNTNQTKNIHVQIVLKDEKGKQIASMIQTLEGIEAGKKKILQTGMMGDYSQVKDVEFKVLTDSQINELNNE